MEPGQVLLQVLVVLSTLNVEILSDWPCLYAKPCMCDYNNREVDCTNKNLTNIPNPINYLDGQWAVDFSNNTLTYIPKDAFNNISVGQLRLSNNQLTSIEDGAFKGSESTIFVLNLENNLLKDIPGEVGKLDQLFILRLDGNPIKTFRDDVFIGISGRLGSIVFGSKEMSSWPDPITRCAALFEMTIKDASIGVLPDKAFTGLKNLHSLTFISTSLVTFPISFRILKLSQLELDDNKQLKEDGFPKESFETQHELRRILINNGSIETLPPIFAEMNSLAMLDIENTPLKYINKDVFPLNFSSIFVEFRSHNSLLKSVPPVLSSIPTLSTLKLTYNKITYINEPDFSGNRQLGWLYLSGNPISGISDKAFKHNPTLWYLYLDNTKLTTIPRAIQNVHKLMALDLTNTPITCSCQNLGWLKYWKRRTQDFRIIGTCYMQEISFDDFVKHEIPNC